MVLLSSIIFGRLGDVVGRKKMILLGFLTCAFVFFGHNLIKNISGLFILRGLAGVGVGMIPGSLAALAWGGSLGLFTAMGSLGFTGASFLAGMLKENFYIFSGSALFALVGFFLTLFVREHPVKLTVPLFPIKIIFKNIRVYLPYLIRHSAATAIWAIFPIYLMTLGADKFWIGVIYAINPLMQFIFMLLFDRYKSSSLISAGLIASFLTFLGYAVTGHWQVVIVLQVLLGFSWANLYLGSIKFLLENNAEKATATGILNSVFGLSGIIGPLMGGLILFFGLRTLLYFSTFLAFGAVIVSRILKLPEKILLPQ
ncbi:hypothetical protein BXT86_05680 [candidate division WOR-3 bacterium 4484_100]|uniref:Major facilitator superfamily (MFS) profile domain-containing protein n=1 Tax=candidate division WOR-3 bacterium 4484_100 TaxID=1936077 RepID=A0A1V4QFT2_UNCW3|nr:MAG: hypothetical protein BXT86_05680 [candidate division WOR-3 bacterium 4484_100]